VASLVHRPWCQMTLRSSAMRPRSSEIPVLTLGGGGTRSPRRDHHRARPRAGDCRGNRPGSHPDLQVHPVPVLPPLERRARRNEREAVSVERVSQASLPVPIRGSRNAHDSRAASRRLIWHPALGARPRRGPTGRMRFVRGTGGEQAAGPDLSALGSRARWGRVGYVGAAFAPPPGTYPLIDTVRLAYTSVQDSGSYPARGSQLANLYPLVAAALYDIGFAAEAGPLTTWSN